MNRRRQRRATGSSHLGAEHFLVRDQFGGGERLREFHDEIDVSVFGPAVDDPLAGDRVRIDDLQFRAADSRPRAVTVGQVDDEVAAVALRERIPVDPRPLGGGEFRLNAVVFEQD
jgi:hypothetical protein